MMNLSENFFKKKLIDNWHLNIYNTLLYLGNGYKNITYNPKLDTIETENVSSKLQFSQLINAPISEIHINEGAKELINKNLHSSDKIILEEDDFNKEKTIFDIEEHPIGLKLKKKK